MVAAFPLPKLPPPVSYSIPIPHLFQALLGGPGFSAPPTFLVASTVDNCCAPREHTDPYARACRERRVPLKYLRRDFGDHGFGLEGGWVDSCVKWLRASGFGKPLLTGKGQKRPRP